MRKLLLLGLVGLLAQFVDGALGMGYGVTSSSLLLALVGLTPALASASVHLAEVGTTLASGTAHWKLGNVDWRLVLRLGVPGAIGAFAGATVLSRLSTEWATPVMAAILAALGLYILSRFAFRPPANASARRSPHTTKFLAPLGLVGGFVDATGGGGWGPVATTTLLGAGKTAPRTVIGSVDTSEFIVSVAASIGFLAGLGTSGIDLGIVLALLIGGLIAAPLAAWLVSRLPARVLGVGVGGLIVLTNARTLLRNYKVDDGVSWVVYGLIVALWVGLLALTITKHRRSVADDAEAVLAAEADRDAQAGTDTEIEDEKAEGVPTA